MVGHGKINCSWQSNILHLDVFGPFNVIGVQNAFKQLKEQVNAFSVEQWYRIDVIDEQTLGCPEVMKIISQTYVWSLENHCQMIAIVCANRVQYSLLTSFIERSGLNIRAYTDRQAAFDAVNQLANAR